MLKQKDQISLKEAAEISGYTPDYLGQLIRSGKLQGEQVYLNVAWVTSETAVIEYMKKNKNGSDRSVVQARARVLTSEQRLSGLYRWVALVVIGFLSITIIFLVAVLAVSIDHKIEKKYEQKIEHAN